MKEKEKAAKDTKPAKPGKKATDKSSESSDYGVGTVPRKKRTDANDKDGTVPKKRSASAPKSKKSEGAPRLTADDSEGVKGVPAVILTFARKRKLNESQLNLLTDALDRGRKVFLKSTVTSKIELGEAILDIRRISGKPHYKRIIEKYWLPSTTDYQTEYKNNFKVAIRLAKNKTRLPKRIQNIDVAKTLLSFSEKLPNDVARDEMFAKIAETGEFNGASIDNRDDIRNAVKAAKSVQAGEKDSDGPCIAAWKRLKDQLENAATDLNETHQQARKELLALTKRTRIDPSVKTLIVECYGAIKSLDASVEDLRQRTRKIAKAHKITIAILKTEKNV